MMNSAIAENYQSGFGSYSGMANIESKINFSMQYNPLEMQLSQLQPLAEPEDPPETLHTPWGIWLQWRDPLHKIHQRFDAAHVVRTGMAAEDILHYAHYVPVIGEHENIQSHELKFEYDYSSETQIYAANIALENNAKGEHDETAGAIADTEENFADAEDIAMDNAENFPDEPEQIRVDGNKHPLTSFNSALEEQITKLVERLFGLCTSRKDG